MREPLARRALFACLGTGAVGLLVLGVQPLLYGALVASGRITEAELGLLAAAEIAAIAGGSMIGVPMLARWPSWLVGLAGVALLIVGDLGSIGQTGVAAILGWRVVAGVGGGLLVALAAVAIARAPGISAASAAFLLLQALSQYAVLQWCARPGAATGPDAVLTTLAGAAVLALALLALIPAALHPAPEHAQSGKASWPPLPGILALLAAALFVGGAVGIWAYLGVWLAGRGLDDATVAAMLTASLGGQIGGAALGMAIGERWDSRWRIALLTVLLLGLVGSLFAGGSARALIWAVVSAYGFVWMLATPAFSGFLLEVDATRRALPYGAGAQLLGAAIMPLLAGALFGAVSLDGVLLACAAACALSLATALAASMLAASGDYLEA